MEDILADDDQVDEEDENEAGDDKSQLQDFGGLLRTQLLNKLQVSTQ